MSNKVIRKYREIFQDDPEVGLIGLAYNRHCVVDIGDLRKLAMERWRIMRPGTDRAYAMRHEGRGAVYMHREIIGAKDGEEVDHINGDGLDNRRANLRICTRRQNNYNTRKRDGKSSKYKGVCWSLDHKKWRANITDIAGRQVFLGYFDSEVEAAKAYDEQAKVLYGDFARMNLPPAPKPHQADFLGILEDKK